MHDVIIIGGSFAGLAAATQLGRARRRVLVLDTGAPRNRFAPHSHGFFSRDGMPPLELLAEARAQLKPYRTVEFHNARAIAARQTDEGFEVTLAGGERIAARKLILAHGMVDDLSVLPQGAEACWGKTMFFCPYCHGFEFGDQRLGLLLRQGDPLDLAKLYREWSDRLTLFTNGAPVDGMIRQALGDLGVSIVDDTVIAFEHDNGDMRGVITAGGAVAIDALFTHPPARFSTNIGLELGCETKETPAGLRFATSEWKATSVPGVAAAGDIALAAPSISYAVADGVAAGASTHRSLFAG
ncbi:MAG TPA: NAD(P)/FAD-dependent oxidoreductase [Devosia sp.]|nr:NAD(P)/FAD-dependent oxidoreductase [Devosia sp.]